MNRLTQYSDEQLNTIIRTANDAMGRIEPEEYKSWLLGGIIDAKRELMRREEAKRLRRYRSRSAWK
jgi:hypothetical protein